MTKVKREKKQQLIDASNDRAYFIITPRLVWAFSRNPFDYCLWNVVKDIAGDRGVCTIETSDLATLAMMSAGQVHDSREWLMAAGLLHGKLYREPHYTNPIWHLTVPDLWKPNVEWSQQFIKIEARLTFKKEQKEAVEKVWKNYRKVKAQRKTEGTWKYDNEMPLDIIALSIAGMNKKTDSPSESIPERRLDKMDSPYESAPTYGESAPTWGETKKIIKKINHDEWMNDPIVQFLRALPGYNPVNLKLDRQAIVEKSYSLEALDHLWKFAQRQNEPARGTPIGLFLAMIARGQHAPAYLELLEQRRHAQAAEQIVVKRRSEIVTLEPDDSVCRPLSGHAELTAEQAWQAALGELQLEMNKATFETWVKPTCVLSVNGTWQIGTPNDYAREWLESRLHSVVQRILAGIVGEAIELTFIVARQEVVPVGTT